MNRRVPNLSRRRTLALPVRKGTARRLAFLAGLRVVLLAWLGSIAAAAPSVAADAPNNYRLAPGDSIHITVFQNPDLSLDTRVSEDSAITYPLVGRVAIGNSEIATAERTLAKALLDGGYLKNPQVSIQLLEVRGNKVSVLGQVGKPGSFALQSTSTRLSQVLADAGGQTAAGDDKVILTGTRDGKPFRREVDIDALYRNQRPEEDVVVAGGDTVYVPRAPMFYIYGEVTRPGTYRIERNMTMRQALAAAGGLTLRGTERRLQVVRPSSSGTPERRSADLNDTVVTGDTIYVAESIF